METQKTRSARRRPRLFMMRTDADWWRHIDELQLASAPVRSRSEIVRELVADAARKLRASRRRGRPD